MLKGRPGNSLGHVGGGESYFDGLWKSGAGSHSSHNERWIISVRKRKSPPQEGGEGGGGGKKKKKRSAEKQRERNERRREKRRKVEEEGKASTT